MKWGDDTGKDVSAGVGAGRSLAGGAHGLSGKRSKGADSRGRHPGLVGAGAVPALPRQIRGRL